MKRIIVLIFLIGLVGWSQNPQDIRSIQSHTNLKGLLSLKESLYEKFQQDSISIVRFQQYNPSFSRRFVSNDGVTYEIKEILNGQPIYRSTDNLNAARATKTIALQAGGDLGLSLSGEGLYVGVWDGGLVRKSHVEFIDNSTMLTRVTTPESVLPSPPSSGHATHVAGTIGAQGISANAKGMAPSVSIISYDWNNDMSEVVDEIANNSLLLSNHSYGTPISNNDGEIQLPIWVMGCYDGQSVAVDNIAFNAPYYLMVASAGNEGAFSYSGGLAEGFDKLTYEKNAKNNLVIANANPFVLTNGVLVNVVINSSSSQGPSDDGRVKPDLAGDGTNLESTWNTNDTSYATQTGTSMASPNVAGSLALLQEYYNDLNGVYMRSATLKGLVCHNAYDAGTVGPDPRFGWGLLDARQSAITLANEHEVIPISIIEELTLNQGDVYSFDVTVNNPQTLKATICWTDVPGSSNNGMVNSPTPALVNDLDIRITKNAEINYPWKLQLSDVTAPAIKGDNTVDNVEKAEVDNASGTYTIEVSHKGTLTNGLQNYSLIVTGFDVPELSLEDFNVEGVKMFPNPSEGELNFRTPSGITLDKIEIFDTLGKQVLLSTEEVNSLDISSFNPGVYFVRMYSQGSMITKKMIKN